MGRAVLIASALAVIVFGVAIATDAEWILGVRTRSRGRTCGPSSSGIAPVLPRGGYDLDPIGFPRSSWIPVDVPEIPDRPVFAGGDRA